MWDVQSEDECRRSRKVAPGDASWRDLTLDGLKQKLKELIKMVPEEMAFHKDLKEMLKKLYILLRNTTKSEKI